MTDPRTARLVALLIGLVALVSATGTVALLLLTDREADAAVVGLAATGLGYLAGLLTQAPGGDPQRVVVEQPPGDPVPVEPID